MERRREGERERGRRRGARERGGGGRKEGSWHFPFEGRRRVIDVASTGIYGFLFLCFIFKRSQSIPEHPRASQSLPEHPRASPAFLCQFMVDMRRSFKDFRASTPLQRWPIREKSKNPHNNNRSNNRSNNNRRSNNSNDQEPGLNCGIGGEFGCYGWL